MVNESREQEREMTYLDASEHVLREVLRIKGLQRELEREGDTVGIGLLAGEVQRICDSYGGRLNTPEGTYLRSLVSGFRGEVPEAVYDIEISDLGLSARAKKCLKNDGVEYVGQLVGRTEKETLRSPNLGIVSLREIGDVLDNLGLKFGMDINYQTPEEREQAE